MTSTKSAPRGAQLNGARILTGWLTAEAQRALVDDVRDICKAAPLVRHATPRGKPLSVRMTAAGQAGWVSGPRGYRYARQQADGSDWPPIPRALLELWADVVPGARAPESCLVNFYGEDARMGLHVDRDEADTAQPVVSVSLGDDGLFRVGGPGRRDPTRSVWLSSGDVAILEGPSRLYHHGVDRIRFGSSTLLPRGGRLNLTLRVIS